MAMKAGYKQTEVGVIPDDWDVSTVGAEFEIKLGKMLDSEKNVGVSKPYLGNKSVQWGRIDLSDLPTVPMTRADLEKYRLREGDLLVCEGGDVGRAALWNSPLEECYYQKALHRLRPLRGFDSRLMVELLRHWSDRGLLANYVTQTSIAHLPREKFMGVPVPVPPVPEQRAIATALSDVDALLSALERLLAKKRDLKQAAMQQLLTGQTRLPGFYGEWEVKRLGEMGEIVMGQSPSSSNYNSQGDGLPLIQGNADIANRKTIKRVFTTQITKRGRAGDILMSVRAPVGEVSRATFDLCIGRGVCAIRYPNDFLYHYLIFLEPMWAKHSKGSTFESVNSTDVRGVEIQLSSDLPEQIAIAAVLSDMDAELAALEQRLAKTRTLKQGMMQELLTGRIRLL
ncbi:restriction endonuclease subunit S [Pseudomonas shirazensis]|uniref:restriction endonuclease subunit S n=1 Tax=Pseudomonas shirazensis TaxID=2745494 RepID=UPI00164624C1|nr:restriction endonuclease subunit S [Pseudomonas shirazensis]MBV4502647.1 restriction endonuclease subunit S [Pseudomonas shirazensis]